MPQGGLKRRERKAVKENITKVRIPPKIYETKSKIKGSKGSQWFETQRNGVKSGLELQSVIRWELGSGEWRGGGGGQILLFFLSWSIWFARPCSLNTLPPSSLYQQQYEIMLEAKTHTHTCIYSSYSVTRVNALMHAYMHIRAHFNNYTDRHLMAQNITYIYLSRYLNY